MYEQERNTKYLSKGCHCHVECPTATLLVTLTWRIPLFSRLLPILICSLTLIFAVSGQCLRDQRTSLLELKSNLKFNSTLSTKLVRSNESVDCCSWEGVTCSEGCVVGLYLDNESIFGKLDNSSSLFHLHCLQELSLANNYSYNSVIPGSEIPKWFTHQSIGDEVSIQEPNSLLCNELIRIAVCAVFCSHPHHQILKQGSLFCWLRVNGKQMHSAPGTLEFVPLSDHTWLLYFLPQLYDEEEMKKSLCECDANGFSQIGIKIESYEYDFSKKERLSNCFMIKKCGLRMVYKKDVEDLNFDNSTAAAAAAEGYKAKRTRDDYDGVGSSNYDTHPKRIERVTKFMGEGNSNCEESSENKECAEELGD